MINNIQLIRNICQFDSITCNQSLSRLTLIYAENARGKTTLAAILRSMSNGDPMPILERQRLTTTNTPHVVIVAGDPSNPVVFQNAAWNFTLNNMVVFDDIFVAENVHSGLVVGPGHRQRLHELIVGAQGISLNQNLSALVKQIEIHNTNIKTKANAIPAAVRGPMSVDDFCSLQQRPNIDAEIEETERLRTAAQQQAKIASTDLFSEIALPAINVGEILALLQRSIDDLDSSTVAEVEKHVSALGENGETWLADGLWHESQLADELCPFCQRSVSNLPILNIYRAYFSAAYSTLKKDVESAIRLLEQKHAGHVPADFERAIRIEAERCLFWSQFTDLKLEIPDTTDIVAAWGTAYQAVMQALHKKRQAPLEKQEIDKAAKSAIETYDSHREHIQNLNNQLLAANDVIRLVKEQAETANVSSLDVNLMRLRATKERYSEPNDTLCQDYLSEKAAKNNTEQLRDQAKATLETYRQTVFPAYETAINLYLQRFNASFRLGDVRGATGRAGTTCTYNVLINNIPVAAGTAAQGTPTFRTTLSAGDRNTLALAFFFASLEQDPDLVNKVVIIDDPITSLDEHRTLTTAQEIRRLAGRVQQVIVLSHDKSFLCRVWGNADRTYRSALQLVRVQNGSSIGSWNPNEDSTTEYDRRHQILREYATNGAEDTRSIAESIRPVLEGFLRVACPECFPPGTMLGPFQNNVRPLVGCNDEVLSAAQLTELQDLTEYANRFHHDTNPAWENETINDGELSGFVQRTLTFTRF